MPGSIEVGKYADFTILDKDILTLAPEEIPDTNVIYTIAGGEIKYQHNRPSTKNAEANAAATE